MLIADIDRFKLINDTYGHAAGDEVLREVARRMSGLTREGDSFGRYGGEEFLAVLNNCDENGAQIAAERLRQGVCQEPIIVNGIDAPHPITVSVSIGVTSTRLLPEHNAADMVRVADGALYNAKNAGRNRVCVARPLPVQPTVAEAVS